MKRLKKTALAAAALLVVLVGVGLVLPSRWTMERAVVADAAPEDVLPLLADLRRWQEWSAWPQMDPAAEWEYSPSTAGVGASMRWKGPKLGSGSLTLEQVDATRVGYRMRFEGGTPAVGGFTLAREGALRTRIVWRDEGDMGMNLAGRYFLPFLESMLADTFEKGLASLASRAAAAAAERPAPSAAARP